MALPKLRSALSAAAGTALVMTPLAAANGQQAEMQPVAANSYSAGIEATRWSLTNRGGVGVAVSLGTVQQITTDEIEEAISRRFRQEGVTNLRYFYEQNDMPGTAFSLHVDGGSSGVLTIGEVAEAIPVVARDARFMSDHPELARN